MAYKTKEATNKGTIMILQVLTLIIGVIAIQTIIGLPLAILLVFLEGRSVKYKYTCSECCNTVGEESKKCYTCGSVFR